MRLECQNSIFFFHFFLVEMTTSRAANDDDGGSRKRMKVSSGDEGSRSMVTPPLSECRSSYSSVTGSKTAFKWGSEMEPSLAPADKAPNFEGTAEGFNLCFHLNAVSKSARAATVHFPARGAIGRENPAKVETPVFMPVGTKGTIKALTYKQLMEEESLRPQIILGNAYHLAREPGRHVLDEFGGLHNFSNWKGEGQQSSKRIDC